MSTSPTPGAASASRVMSVLSSVPSLADAGGVTHDDAAEAQG